ncbi:spore germination lipoprotein GerD [Paenibacillus sp. YYML68]|uniref:spore germination lipoprotein GerD n=1 Tax=Paenibacillus sp. YYML68 TaxID=2909250 RepID=UPI002490DB85|nr:spore germination lipoprotein GerD [Paenibacillus sp. YYML68]
MRTNKSHYLIPAVLLAGLLSACGSDTQGSSGGGMNTYKDTKSMVLDILKTEDGQKAIQEATIQADSKLQLLSAGDTQQLQLAVKDVLVDTDNNKFLQKMIKDPKFAGQFAKAIQSDTKNLQKDLMKDPEYQKALLAAMKGPEYETMMLDVLKTPSARTQIKALIQESMQSPLVKLELMELMKKVLEDEISSKSDGGGKEQAGGEGGKQGGGGEGGGQGGEQGGGGEGGGEGGEQGGGGEGGGEGEQGGGGEGGEGGEGNDEKKME